MKQAPVLFKGIGHSLNSANNLAMKVLGASPSTYSANPKSKLSNPPSLTGSAISLVSVVQARNNARIMIAGSLDMFSNGLFKSGVQKAGSSNKIWKRRSRLNFYKVVLVLHLLNEIIQ
ncbi:dolichyl-diphosphooligosaccharide--protein glycosyltransferase 48 kDa subunit-like isoform X1 [Camellia sinensis]|uniref:dolichyl-diphosphooligosaccharide--protein glycosyltransferase 48 kDa subunit-like isoform X1 n=2 Tax=Camellia sinensis TaxID=4442 RepID=UPI001036CEEB|nr:dolichyl-diphosphooligosaccharide--protein glycosyltransferase 48 kDa subunit-like isoform X1 [Camellia sinensis]